jgi:translation initiation factor 1 (eIF-1/SUI1)
MKDKKLHIETTGPATSLTANPFASLLKGADDLPLEPKPATAELRVVMGRRFTIGKTKKGGYPVSIEKRAAGKVVTIIRNISGDTAFLLSLLKKHCAAGGKAFEDSVEIQGDHSGKIEAYLRKEGF